MGESWNRFGASLGDVAKIIYIYLVIAALVLLITITVIVSYVQKSKQQKESGEPENKNSRKHVPGRIGVIILAALCLLILSPIIFLFFTEGLLC